MAVSPNGFALRKNGTCELQEVDCGPTVDPYRVCCPHASSCPRAYNVDCCPTSANCTASLLPKPRCANGTWDLYDNGGYFCCLKGMVGYAATATDSNGCAAPGYEFQPGDILLTLVRAGASEEIVGSSTSTSSSTGITPSTSPESSGELSTGARAGIGVGAGIGGLILLVCGAVAIKRYMNRGGGGGGDITHGPPGTASELQAGGKTGEKAGCGSNQGSTPVPSELPDNASYYELDGNVKVPRAEVQG